MLELAYVNGLYSPLSEARVPIDDRGFQFADGVYEVIVYHGRHPVLLAEHIERLQRSCREIHLPIDWEALNLAEAIERGVQQAGFAETMVYVQITRGAAPRNHVYPQGCSPTVVITFRPKPELPPEKRASGIAVLTRVDFRWGRCDIKSTALLPNVMAKNEALAAGCDDVLFIGRDGEVREASAANVFAVRRGRLLTPPLGPCILPGITRLLIRTCAENLGTAFEEQPLTRDDLLTCDEVFLSSSVVEILPVVRIDGCAVGSGKPGPVSRRLQDELVRQTRLVAC